jgi:hypothetical protein
MRTAQELAAMTYDEVTTAWHRYEISEVEKDAWYLANGIRMPRGFRAHPETTRLLKEIKALPAV